MSRLVLLVSNQNIVRLDYKILKYIPFKILSPVIRSRETTADISFHQQKDSLGESNTSGRTRTCKFHILSVTPIPIRLQRLN